MAALVAMRTMLAALTGLAALSLLVPGAAAVWQPPPICPACTVIAAIAVQCANAEVQQQAFGSGDGCAIVDQERDCAQAEVDQDAFNEGSGCSYVNGEQNNVGWQLCSVERLLGIAC